MARPRKCIEAQIAASVEDLLDKGKPITAAAVAAMLGVATSTITRDARRKDMVEEGEAARQVILKRAAAAGQPGKAELLRRLEASRAKIGRLERQVMVLTIAHRAMLKAVAEQGGMAAWQQHFVTHQQVLEEIRALTS